MGQVRLNCSVSLGILTVYRLFPVPLLGFSVFFFFEHPIFFLPGVHGFLSISHQSLRFALPACAHSVSVIPRESKHVFLLCCGSCVSFGVAH